MTRRVIPFALLILAVVSDRTPGQEKYADPELTPKQRQHWSFIPPKRPTVPKTAIPVTNPIEVTILREQHDVATEKLEELFADARSVYQEVFAVPALSPHGRFDVHEWRPLTPVVKGQPSLQPSGSSLSAVGH